MAAKAAFAALDRASRSRIGPPLMGAALGATASFAQAPASAWWILALALPGLYALYARAATARQAALLGYAAGFGYFFPGLLWIGEAFLVDAETFAWMRPFAVTLLPAGLALFWATAFWGARKARLGPAGLAAAWALAEFARGHLLTGLPWGLFAYATIETPIAQGAALIGPYGLTFVIMLAGLGLGAALHAWLRAEGVGMTAAAAGAGVVALIAIAAFGVIRVPAGSAAETDVVARLVQPNIPQAEKWRRDLLRRNFQRLRSLSFDDGAAGVDLFIWPETAVIPQVITRDDWRAYMIEAMPAGAALVVGSQRRGEGEGEVYYNSLFTIDAEAEILNVYDKRRLVPFGEFLPFQDVLEALGLRQLAGRRGGFGHGAGPRLVALEGRPSFVPLICYEAIFPQAMPRGEERPDFLLHATNDAWFGGSSGPWQHLVQAQFRAIEQGVPILRASNTGVSGQIDPYGRLTDHLEMQRLGHVDVRLRKSLQQTLYARTADLSFLFLLATTTMIIWRTRRRAVPAQDHVD